MELEDIMIKRIMTKMISPLLGRKRLYKLWYKLYRYSLKGMNADNGGDITKTGEINIINHIKQNKKNNTPVLFDVGANVGNYTRALLNCFGDNCVIHSFEPAEKTFQTLSQNIKTDNVILNNFGISNEATVATLYYDKEKSPFSSVYQRQSDYHTKDFGKKSETIKLDTIDNYCNKNNIEYIDFLKLDIEGHEVKALMGAHKMLSSKKIGAIQFEFCSCNIDSRTFFRDFWNILHTDYHFYRILKDGLVEIMQYNELLESFKCSNYLLTLK